MAVIRLAVGQKRELVEPSAVDGLWIVFPPGIDLQSHHSRTGGAIRRQRPMPPIVDDRPLVAAIRQEPELKTGQGIGGAVAAYTIGLGGYIATAKTQTGSALTSIRVAAGIIPAALFLAAAAVMLVYPLTEKAFRAIVAEMAERRAAAELASAARRMT